MEYVVLYLSEMRIVHDQSALHATLYGVSFEDARSILTLAVFVKVGAIFPENTPLAARFDARVGNASRAAADGLRVQAHRARLFRRRTHAAGPVALAHLGDDRWTPRRV